MYFIFGLVFLGLIVSFLSILPYIFLVIAIIVGGFLLCKGLFYLFLKSYMHIYFNSDNFKKLVNDEQSRVKDINALNSHIIELNNEISRLGTYSCQYGTAFMEDTSKYTFQRKTWKSFSNENNVYHCSLQICKNAQNNPMKYLCKYFNVGINRATINILDKKINTYSAIVEGKASYENKKSEALLKMNIPWIIKKFCLAEFEKRIGYKPVAIKDIRYPEYIFQYISAGGNSSATCKIKLDIPNLEALERYISDRIRYLESAIGQRRLMTRALRDYIKRRDNFTCCNCGISIKDEAHLLLEIDHIKPISKGGLTEESNLQTLCWRCNRKKGASY